MCGFSSHRLASVILGLVSLAILASCSGFGIDVDAGYTSLELDGDIGLNPTVGGVNLDTVRADVQSDLGLSDKMKSAYGRIEAAAGIASFTFSGFDIDQDGTGQLTVQFGDIPLNTPVRTSIAMKNLKGAVHFDVINFGPVRLSPGIGVDLFDLNIDVQSVLVPTLRESVDALAPIPMLFLQGEVDLGYLDFTADVGGMKINLQDGNGTFFDVEAILRVRPADYVELFAGYRYILLDVEGQADNQRFLGDLTLRGFMVGGGIYF